MSHTSARPDRAWAIGTARILGLWLVTRKSKKAMPVMLREQQTGEAIKIGWMFGELNSIAMATVPRASSDTQHGGRMANRLK